MHGMGSRDERYHDNAGISSLGAFTEQNTKLQGLRDRVPREVSVAIKGQQERPR